MSENSVPVKSENAVPAQVAELVGLAPNASLKDVVAKVNELVAKLNAPKAKAKSSEKEMTEDDARRVIGGDLKGLSHAKAAEKLGLSYGQVYSARLGFTFKAISKEVGAWKKSA